ncbi:hypothetical protein Unana1_02380 [Umbelopsis nana]
MTKQRLAIIGKGLVATAIAKQASPTYGSVTLVSRNKPLELDQLPERVTHIQGNALYPSSFSDTIRAADAVVSTVGTLKEGKDKDRTFERVNRDSVVSVAREMVKTQPAHLDKRCLVYFSFANAPPAFFLDPRYVNSKREAEDALLSQEFKDALRVVIFRPGKSIAQAGEDSTHGLIYSTTQRKFILPIAVESMIMSAVLRPFRNSLPDGAKFLADKPLSDDIVAMAVLEAIKKPDVHGIIEVDEIQKLSSLWRQRL